MDFNSLYTGSVYLHNLLRWVIVILLVVSLLIHLVKFTQNKYYTAGDLKRNTYLMSASHLMLLLGMFQWIAGPWGLKNIQDLGMGVVMKDPVYRFWAVEHFTAMLIAIIVITIGRGQGKKAISDPNKHQRTTIYFGLAFLIAAWGVPWKTRPLIPGGKPVTEQTNTREASLR